MKATLPRAIATACKPSTQRPTFDLVPPERLEHAELRLLAIRARLGSPPQLCLIARSPLPGGRFLELVLFLDTGRAAFALVEPLHWQEQTDEKTADLDLENAIRRAVAAGRKNSVQVAI